MDRVLVIDDNVDFLESMGFCLEDGGFQVEAAKTAAEGLRAALKAPPRVILLDLNLPDGSGLSVLRELNKHSVTAPVLMVTGFPTSGTVMEALRLGALDYLTKPISPEFLIRTVRSFIRRPGSSGYEEPQDRLESDEDAFLGRSQKMLDVFKSIGRVAPTSAPVLLRGESGSGKELAARAIHCNSNRTGPFVPINCSAVVETLAESELFGHEKGAFTGAVERRRGRFEMADGGTLFLDEIGDAPLSLQVKLLRALDRGEFERVGGRETVRPDVRIVTATNRDLEEMVREGRFREDLYYRLSVVTIHLPPLRDRQEDIPFLTRHLIRRISCGLGRRIDGISHRAVQKLMIRNWPGNVRELDNVLTRAVINAGEGIVESDDLPTPVDTGRIGSDKEEASPVTLAEAEQVQIERVLQVTSGNRGRACELLGITRPTLRRKMREYGL